MNSESTQQTEPQTEKPKENAGQSLDVAVIDEAPQEINPVKIVNWKPGPDGKKCILFYSMAVRPNSDYPKRTQGMAIKFPGEPAYHSPVSLIDGVDLKDLRAETLKMVDKYFDNIEKAVSKESAQ